LAQLQARRIIEGQQTLLEPQTQAALDKWRADQANPNGQRTLTAQDEALLRRNHQQIQMEAHRSSGSSRPGVSLQEYQALQADHNRWLQTHATHAASDVGLESWTQRSSGPPKPGTDFDGLAGARAGGATPNAEQYLRARQVFNQRINQELINQELPPLENPAAALEADIMTQADRVSGQTYRDVEAAFNRDGGTLYGDQSAAQSERLLREGEMPSVESNARHMQEQLRQARSHNAESTRLLNEGRELVQRSPAGSDDYRRGLELLERGQLAAERGIKYESRLQDGSGRLSQQVGEGPGFRPATPSQGAMDQVLNDPLGSRGGHVAEPLAQAHATAENRISQRLVADAQRLVQGGHYAEAAELARNLTPNQRGRLLESMPAEHSERMLKAMRANSVPDRWIHAENRWELNSNRVETRQPSPSGGGRQPPGGSPANRGPRIQAGAERAMVGVAALNAGQDLVDYQEGLISEKELAIRLGDNALGGAVGTTLATRDKIGEAGQLRDSLEAINAQALETYGLAGAMELRRAGVSMAEAQRIMQDLRQGDASSFQRKQEELAAQGVVVVEPVPPRLERTGRLDVFLEGDDYAHERAGEVVIGLGHAIGRAGGFLAEAVGARAGLASVEAYRSERGSSGTSSGLMDALVRRGATSEEAYAAVSAWEGGDQSALVELRNRLIHRPEEVSGSNGWEGEADTAENGWDPAGLTGFLQNLDASYEDWWSGAFSGDDGGAPIGRSVIGGDLGADTLLARTAFQGRAGAHADDPEASLNTGNPDPLGDLNALTTGLGGAVRGVNDALQGWDELDDFFDDDDDTWRGERPHRPESLGLSGGKATHHRPREPVARIGGGQSPPPSGAASGAPRPPRPATAPPPRPVVGGSVGPAHPAPAVAGLPPVEIEPHGDDLPVEIISHGPTRVEIPDLAPAGKAEKGSP
jgi:hypothetical protein